MKLLFFFFYFFYRTTQAQPTESSITSPLQNNSTSPVILSDGYVQYIPPNDSQEPQNQDMKKQSNMDEENVAYVNDGAGDQNDEAGYEVMPNRNEDNANTPYAAVC